MGPIFEFDTTRLSIPQQFPGISSHIPISTPGNITATDLGLADKYSFYLWNYATTTGGKTTFHKKGWDYVNNIDISQDNTHGNSTLIVDQNAGTKSSVRDKIRVSQALFVLALLSTFAGVAMGVSGALNFPVSLLIISAWTGLTLVATLVFAVLITVLIFSTKSDLGTLRKFGLKFDMGTSDLGVVWLATIHMLVVGIMWLLMAFGLLKCNKLLRQPLQARSLEIAYQSGEDHFPIVGERK
jgi:hypothetical protein